MISQLSKLRLVAKYSKTDEDINKLGYYDLQKNLLVIFPDNIYEKCQNENLDFEEAIITFFQNFVALLKYRVTSTVPLAEQIEISCTEQMTFQPEHREKGDVARLLLGTNKEATYTELEQAILDQNLTEIYHMFSAKTAADFCKINQLIASLANRNKESSIFKDLIIVQTNDKYQDLLYTFQAGIEKIMAITQTHPQITLEQALTTYNVLQNIIAQPLYGTSQEELNQITPQLIKLNDSFLNYLSLYYSLPIDEIITAKNSGQQILFFLNLTTPNPEQLTTEEQEKIFEIYSYYHHVLQLLSYTENLTAFEWDFTLQNTNETEPPKTAETTIQYSYTFDANQEHNQSMEEQTPTTVKYSLSLTRNTKY